MAITKPPVLPAWADAGDKVQPSNADLSVGWPVSSTPPSRQRFNWVLNFVANAVRYFSRRGLVDYDAAETYMTGDRIIGDDGKTYRCLADNTTGLAPSTNPARWVRWGFTLAELDAERTTPPQFDNTTKTATTAFVQRALGNLPTPALLQQSAYMSAVGAGTVDAITAAFTPAIAALPAAPGTLSVFVRATGANTSTTPTFKADGTTAKTIVKGNNLPLVAGDIAGSGHWLELQYDATLDKWVLQNPTHGFGGTPPQFDNTTKTATTEFVQRALGSFRTIYVVNGSATLNASYVGSCVLLQAATQFTTTLFSGATVPRGSVIEVANLSSAPQTITGSAANTLVVNGGAAITSITIQPGNSLTLIASGWANLWYVPGTGDLQFSASFGSSLGTAGYQRLPSGLILQWGRLTIGDIQRDYFSLQNFPIAFPNNIFQVNLSLYSFSGVNFDASAAVTGHSQTGFEYTIQEWAGSVQNLELSYFAIGN